MNVDIIMPFTMQVNLIQKGLFWIFSLLILNNNLYLTLNVLLCRRLALPHLEHQMRILRNCPQWVHEDIQRENSVLKQVFSAPLCCFIQMTNSRTCLKAIICNYSVLEWNLKASHLYLAFYIQYAACMYYMFVCVA